MLRPTTRAAFAVVLGATPALAVFPTGAPIAVSQPLTSWSIEIDDVLTVPDSAGQPARMEDLVFGGEAGLAYLLDQRGLIYTFDPAAANPQASLELFLNVASASPSFLDGFQRGLRGMAFHPDFNTPGAAGHRKFYTAQSRAAFSGPLVGSPKVFNAPPGGPDHDSILAEWSVDANGDVDLGSYREVILVGQPEDDHNIGQIAFNPNAAPGDADYGNLYVALGDGGGGGNPNNTAQDISTLTSGSAGKGFPHGSILRVDPIDPDGPGGAPFSVPADNPFVGQPNTIEEVWAYGLRNPHKFVWDPVSEKMLITDIGQSNVEEVNLGAPGANYGWNVSEGTFETVSTSVVTDLPVGHPSDSFTYPVAQYDHDQNNDGFRDSLFAITSGPVYRGDDIPQLRGRYLFADFSEGNALWAVNVDELSQREDFTDLANLAGGNIAPYERVRLTQNGAAVTLRDIVLDSADRTDIRLEEGPDGEVYLLNKRDGVLRRFASIAGLLEGDFNEDGVVDAADYTSWRENLGVRYDNPDFGVWAGALGSGGPPPAQTVPEPAAAAAALLLAAAGIAVGGQSRVRASRAARSRS